MYNKRIPYKFAVYKIPYIIIIFLSREGWPQNNLFPSENGSMEFSFAFHQKLRFKYSFT